MCAVQKIQDGREKTKKEETKTTLKQRAEKCLNLASDMVSDSSEPGRFRGEKQCTTK